MTQTTSNSGARESTHAAVLQARRPTRKAWPLVALCALVAASAAPVLSGCGGGTKPADTAAAPGDSAATAEPPPALPTPAAPADSSSAAASPADTSPLAQVLTTDPAEIQRFYQASTTAPAAELKPNGAAGHDPLAKGIRDAARKLPAGMKPEGPLATGILKEKQHLQTDVTLAPGKCYSIIGYSKKVKDLDLYLFLSPGLLSGQDLTDDNKPIIGGPPQPMCPVSPTAVTYKLDIFADAGGGEVAVQLFSKGN
jgi:hypothetical protein